MGDLWLYGGQLIVDGELNRRSSPPRRTEQRDVAEERTKWEAASEVRAGNAVTSSGLLNILDGVASAEGRAVLGRWRSAPVKVDCLELGNINLERGDRARRPRRWSPPTSPPHVSPFSPQRVKYVACGDGLVNISPFH